MLHTFCALRVLWSAQAKLALWIQKIGHGKTRRTHQFFIMLNESGSFAASTPKRAPRAEFSKALPGKTA